MMRQAAGRLRAASLVFASGVFLMTSVAALAQSAAPSGYGATLRWYHEQAEAGNPVAQFLLGIKYETGTDVPKDLARAAQLFERAAEQGYTDAQFKLASLLETGRGVAADRGAAEAWYRAAAFDGHAPAQYNLSLMLLSAARDEDALAEGLSWLMRAGRGDVSQAGGILAKWREIVSGDVMARAEELSKLPLESGGASR